MTEIAVGIKNLIRDFGDVRAIDDISLTIPSGIIFGLLGPNGAGKSTIIKTLYGLLPPSSGSATVLGYDTRTDIDEIRRRSGALFANDSLYDHLTAEENLDYQGRIWRLSESERRQRMQELLVPLGLWERRGEVVGGWSRGMKRRLAIARTLFHRPRVLFMDEPSAGLDPAAAAKLHDDLLSMAENEGVTIVLATHNLVEAEQLCTQIAVLRAGRLVTVAPTADLRSEGGTPMLEITGSGFSEDVVALLARRREVAGIESKIDRLLVELRAADVHTWPLVSLLVESGADVEEVHKFQSSLADVFLHMISDEGAAVNSAP